MTQVTYRLRGYLISLPLIFAFISNFFETEDDWLVWSGGVFIFLFGLFLRIWAQEHLHYRLKVKKYLTTTGPYSFVRNPIYLGNTFICAGLVFTSELLWLVPFTLLYCFCIYSLVVSYEERHLLEKYGESYRKYLSEVPRWFPKISYFRALGIRNEYFRASIIAEIHFLLLVLPFVLKETINLSMI
jgi:protein-S-isoprenylcysteine O-methyltransferase Ste14